MSVKSEVPESFNMESATEIRNTGPVISSSGGGSTSMPTINITLVTVEKKIASNTKRRYEAQVRRDCIRKDFMIVLKC